MAKAKAVTLATQAIDLAKAMELTIPSVKGFETEFIANVQGERTSKAVWLEMAVVAPAVFGEGCFTKEKGKGEDWNEDYALFKETLESAVCMKEYGIPMPEIQRVKPGTVLTAKQESERKIAQYCRMTTGVYINRMAKYFNDAVGSEVKVKALPSLAAWCGSAVVALAGKPETTKSKAVAPRINGHVPQMLIDLLACYTIADAKEHAVQMHAWREGVVKEHARTTAVKAIGAIQNRARKAVKSDAAKQSRKVAA